MSVMDKIKKIPAPYLIMGVGGVVLVADYFIEGPDSIASAIGRGIFGGKTERGEESLQQALPQGQVSYPGGPVEVISEPVVVPSGMPGVGYYVVPIPHPYGRPYYPSRRGFGRGPFVPRGRPLQPYAPAPAHPAHPAAHHTGYGWE
jgi:hypothetical protein